MEKPSSRWYACSLVLYAAGLLSKSIVVTLPAALLIWHWWKQGRLTSTDLWRLVPFFAVGLVITVGDLSFYWSETTASLDYSLVERMLIASHALWFYAGKLLWPSELAVIYPSWDIHVADPLAWGYLVAAIALVVALWHFRRQLGRGPLAGALFFAVTISPVLGFVDYTYMKYAFVADRHQYLAGIGVMAVVISSAAYGVRRLSSMWQKGALGIAAVVLVVLGTLTWRQASIYRDDETFNRHIIALNPQARNVHRHLGIALYEQGRYEEALDSYRVAVAHRPNYAKVHSNLGMVLNKLERFEEAETHVRRAIALDPKTKIRYQRLGNALYGQDRYAEAADAYRVSAEHHPDYAQAHSGLGAALNELGRFEEAETHLRRAIALNPNHTEALYHLATLRFKQQRLDEAIEFLQHLIGIEPGHARALGDIGVALFYLGRSDEALQHFDRALSLDPTLEDVRANREAVLEAMKGNVE
ncbi:MAG: tetratricopeptide repeat protein [Candidatus Latescibacteria bacterium]|nr:tetratricopeptide repeat protein [Candidatus Latescibacterota bacterium]